MMLVLLIKKLKQNTGVPNGNFCPFIIIFIIELY